MICQGGLPRIGQTDATDINAVPVKQQADQVFSAQFIVISHIYLNRAARFLLLFEFEATLGLPILETLGSSSAAEVDRNKNIS